MPELPEVETVKRGLAPVMEGQIFAHVTLNRSDLRFPFDPNFKSRLEGTQILNLSRRAKFLQADLSSGDRLFMHLGMSGRFTIDDKAQGQYVHKITPQTKHDHVIFDMQSPQGTQGTRITYNDTRRFGFMELIGAGEPYRLDDLGPEPLSNHFNGPDFIKKIASKTRNIKAVLLDQHIVAGLGNIYVCEALYRARINPKCPAGAISPEAAQNLIGHIKTVLNEAILAGGSTLRDFAQTDGNLGYFQHNFDVYGQEGKACPHCKAAITRITQNGRSTFFCSSCQSQ